MANPSNAKQANKDAAAAGDAAPNAAAPKKSRKSAVADHRRTIGAEIRNLNEPVRRLIISKVVLKNFKSYGGTTVIGPFHKRFTSIVGPNGSGKSNVIDAMLFVFGFRAKQMRFEKLSELIHNSNAYVKLNKNKPLESMEVAIHFCEILDRDPDVDDFEVIAGSELIISREVYRDNSSKYRINGKPSSQKDVSNSLKSFGMDLYNNRFLILQGEVEQISQMKPKATKPEEEGLLEYLEDIIGTNQYLEKIKEAHQEYENLQDQYRERGNRTRVLQKEVEDMLDAKAEADKYIENEKEMLHTKLVISQKEILTAKEDQTVMTKQLEELEQKYKESSSLVAVVEKDRDAALKELKSVEADLDKTTKNQKKLSENLQKMVSKDEDLRKQLLREVKKVEEKIANIKKATVNQPKHESGCKEKLAKCDELMKQVPQMQDELEKAEKSLEELTEKIKPELDAANKELAKREAMLAPVQQTYDQVNKEISVIQSSIELLENNRKEAEARLSTMKQNETKLKESLKKNTASLKKEEENLKKKASDLEANIKKSKDLDVTVKEKSQAYLKKRGEYDAMKREFNEMAGSKDQHRHIMSLAASGKIKGVHGRLGDLGSIPPKYERAFMAAAGGQVDVLIVDTPEVASQVFDELRRQNMGRSSAMALSVLNNDLKRQMETFEKTPLEGMPEGVQYLVQLVQASQPRYKICFFYALRDTLLANNLNDATTVGYKHRRRVVTMDGEVIEPDGRMSGGGVQAKKGGGINTKGADGAPKAVVDSKTLDALKKEIEKEGEQLEALKRELVQVNQNQTLLGKEIGELNYSIDIMKQTVKNDEVQLTELTQSIKKLGDSSKAGDDDSKLKDLKADLEKKKKEEKTIATKVKEQEKNVADAYKMVDNVGKGKLKLAKEKVASIEEKLSTLRSNVEKLRKEAANLQADAEKCGRDIQKLTKEVDQHKSREKQLEQQLNSLEEEAAKLNSEMKEVNAKVDELNKHLKELNTTLAEKNKILQENELSSVDMKHNMEELGKKLKAADQVTEAHEARMKEVLAQFKKTSAMIKMSKEAHEMLYPPEKKKTQLLIIDDDDEVIVEDDDDTNAEAKDKEHQEEEYKMLEEKELKALDIEELNKKIEELEKETSTVPNLAVLEEFRVKVHEFSKKKQELLQVQNSRDAAKNNYEQLCLKRKNEFLSNFAIIAAKLKEMYQTITLGGDAELELVDSTDPFTEGILFSVRPAKKSWKQIQNLSGGEKTLSSLALVFALHHYKPNPVYFMDEIDAALDFRNVSIIAQNIKERTKDAQFIIISLRNQMFELCNQMVGIYKTVDVTKSVCINPAYFDMRKRKLNDDERSHEQNNVPA
ncbi:structural maintenance of chromosomes SMC family protein [Babesia gibsoni]|uniref:Structural maintenance of chromosomes protein n=1 Tax=Babesia gibsoni TaxID=33632 RepID=A0AAD8PEL5_BABGI|nr:structural maintenance of chromosomes SMC family protein [Babesia gibsoni]